MSPVFWKDFPDDFREALSEVVNALQASLTLSATLRRNAQQHADDAVQLEGQIDRAARAVKKLRTLGNGQ